MTLLRLQSCKAELELLETGKYGPLDQDCAREGWT